VKYLPQICLTWVFLPSNCNFIDDWLRNILVLVDFEMRPIESKGLSGLLLYYCEYFKRFGPSPAVIHHMFFQSVLCVLNALSFRFALASHFFWGLWSMIQAKISTIEFGYMVSHCRKAIKSLCVCWVIGNHEPESIFNYTPCSS